MFRIWFAGLKKSEIELEKDKIVNKNDEFLEESFEMVSRIEQEAAETTIENKQNDFPKQYYKMYYLSQTATESEVIKKRKQKLTWKLILNIFEKK